MCTRLVAYALLVAFSSASSSSFATSVDSPPVAPACTAGLDATLAPGATTPSWSVSGLLPVVTRWNSGGGAGVQLEPARITVWRVACARGSALLLRIDAQNGTNPAAEFTMPNIAALQGARPRNVVLRRLDTGGRVPPTSIGVTAQNLLVTLDRSDWLDDHINLDDVVELSIRDPYAGYASPQSFLFLEVPAYAPTMQTYPEAYGPRPINGRYAGNFFDPAKPGEGIVVEIGDVPGQPDTHFLQFAWHSFDNNGAPFWISGGETFTGRPTRLHMPAAYRDGGRFGGGKPAVSQTAWGHVDIAFSDCGHATIDYAANSGLPANIPAGTGRLEWRRLTSVSGYSCD